MIEIGKINKLTVKRKTNISYILTDGKDEYFLHFNEATSELKEKENVDVFLYFDSKGRLSATMHHPFLENGESAFLKVKSVKERLGCFLDNNISKDLLLSTDDLPSSFKAWPKEGDEVLVRLEIKQNGMVARVLKKSELKLPKLLKVGDVAEAIVYRFSQSGMIAVTKDEDYIYIHESLTRRKYRMGEVINPKIININENGDYNGSMIENKELMISQDAKLILDYLNNFGGVLPLSDKSTPEEIKKYFPLSKASFKRALGALYKDGLVELEENKTLLK